MSRTDINNDGIRYNDRMVRVHSVSWHEGRRCSGSAVSDQENRGLGGGESINMLNLTWCYA